MSIIDGFKKLFQSKPVDRCNNCGKSAVMEFGQSQPSRMLKMPNCQPPYEPFHVSVALEQLTTRFFIDTA